MMFGLFKKKTETQKLQEEYAKLIEMAYIVDAFVKVSHINRTEADRLMVEADEIAKKIK
jgi:hypothetical protein